MPALAAYYRFEIQRLRLRLKRHITWRRLQWKVAADGTTQGVAIPDAWADALLEAGLDADEEARFHESYPGSRYIAAIEQEINAARHGTPLDRLAEDFQLTAFDCDLLVLALAPEIDPSIEILYAYALDDSARRYATSQLALALFTTGAEQRFESQKRLTDDAPLFRYELIRLEPGPTGCAFHARPLKLDARVREYLLGAQGLDMRLARLSKPVPAIPLPPPFEKKLESLAAQLQGERASLNLTGPVDSGKILLAREVFAKTGRTLIQIDPHRLPIELLEREELLRVAAREACLGRLAFYMRAPENDPGERGPYTRWIEFTERLAAPVVVDSAERLVCDRDWVVQPVERPGREVQVSMWNAMLGQTASSLNGHIPALVEQFDLGPEGIHRAAGEALGDHPHDSVPPAALWKACRAQSSWRMEDLARKLIPTSGWDDIVLTPDTLRQLQEVAAQVSQRAKVYEDWGFSPEYRRGRGISVLFSGSSGVGKTMSAEVLANHLSLDLYRIDLAGIVSKYIGETEKNLRRIFDTAEQSGAILFFDEADALFGKRTEVKDSHDRYANIEVNYLLQRMEDYRGLAILATNKKSALDKAFLRRLRFLIDFPFPDLAHRKQIWMKSFPKAAPTGDLDFDFLARLEIASGNIRNVAMNAAFLAAHRGGTIEFDDVLHAVRREYSKIDKLVTESEFGEHYGGKR